MAHEPGQDECSRTIAALCWSAWSRAGPLPLVDPRGQVGPRTSRPARGLQDRPQLKKCRGGRPRAAFRDCSLPACVWSPDNPRGIIRSRALGSAGTRASVVARPRNAWARGFLEARALDVSLTSPCPRGSLPSAPPRPGWTACRARRGRHAARTVGDVSVPVFSRKGPGLYRSIPPRVRGVTGCF